MTFKKKGGNHLQLNVLSIPASAAGNARRLYERVAKRHDVRLKEVPGPQKVRNHPFVYKVLSSHTSSFAFDVCSSLCKQRKLFSMWVFHL